MKKVNLLSKAEMKKVTGGNQAGPCSGNWWEASAEICYNCCIGWYQQGPTPVDNYYYEQCASKCGF